MNPPDLRTFRGAREEMRAIKATPATWTTPTCIELKCRIAFGLSLLEIRVKGGGEEGEDMAKEVKGPDDKDKTKDLGRPAEGDAEQNKALSDPDKEKAREEFNLHEADLGRNPQG
jgi:hypothetical protein